MVNLICKFLLVAVLATLLAVSFAKMPAEVRRTAIEDSPCAFSLSDPFGGRVESAKVAAGTWGVDYIIESLKRKSNDFHITFSCAKNASFEAACKEFSGVDFDGKHWIARQDYQESDVDHAKSGGLSNPVLVPLDKGDRRGALYVISDTTGPIRYRNRSLGFCLTGGNGWTLYGGAIVDTAPFRPSKSTESEAIRLIRSIEFITPSAHQ